MKESTVKFSGELLKSNNEKLDHIQGLVTFFFSY